MELRRRRIDESLLVLFALFACLWLAGCGRVSPAGRSGAEVRLEGAPQSRISPRPILRVGTSGDYPPFSEAVGGGGDVSAYRGFDIEVAAAFARDEGFEIEWVRFSWPELVSDLRADRFDVAMSGVTVRPERSAVGRFSIPVVDTGAVLLYRPSEKFDAVESLSPAQALARFDRPDVRIAVNRGGHLERVARKLLGSASLETIADNAAVQRALAERRVDAVVTDTLEAPRWAKGIGSVARLGPLTRDRKAYWVAADRRDLARRLDAWLMAREADGSLDVLRHRELGIDRGQVTARPLDALLAAIDERLALMPWVAEAKRPTGRAVEDLKREEKVLAAARRNVAEHSDRGVGPKPDSAAVDNFYRAQIAAAKSIQRAVLSRPPEFEAATSDLSEVLRPALIRIGDRMAQLVVALRREPEVSGRDIRALAEREWGDGSLEKSEILSIARSLTGLLPGPPQETR